MLAHGDKTARDAFRVNLREDTPLPVGSTQELDPGDILEVRDVAEAIARAEQIVAAPRSSRPRDIFDALARPTDDAVGPATPAPARITPIPAPPSSPLPTVLPPVAVAPAVTSTVRLPRIEVPEEDAYFHPVGGRIRTLADATLDGYRPEPTLLVRARVRRTRFAWIAAAVLVALAGLAVAALFASARPSAPTANAAPPPPTTTEPSAPTKVSASPRARQTAAPAKPTAAPEAPSVPVFDVKSLPTASTNGRRTR